MNDIEAAIFHTASEIEDPQVRAAFLDRACGAEGEVRVRIEAALEDDADFYECYLRSVASAIETLRPRSLTDGGFHWPAAVVPAGLGLGSSRRSCISGLSRATLNSNYFSPRPAELHRDGGPR
jgi:hypothetical protein